MKVYLAGPINGCTDEEAKDWREWVKANAPFQTIDPMRRDYRGREDQFVKEIVELDKLDILQADLILVNYDKPSVGTSMEILFAWMNQKPIVVVAGVDTVISPWLRYHASAILPSFGQAITRSLLLCSIPTECANCRENHLCYDDGEAYICVAEDACLERTERARQTV